MRLSFRRDQAAYEADTERLIAEARRAQSGAVRNMADDIVSGL